MKQLSEHTFCSLFGRFHFQILVTFSSSSLSLKKKKSSSEQKSVFNDCNVSCKLHCMLSDCTHTAKPSEVMGDMFSI